MFAIQVIFSGMIIELNVDGLMSAHVATSEFIYNSTGLMPYSDFLNWETPGVCIIINHTYYVLPSRATYSSVVIMQSYMCSRHHVMQLTEIYYQKIVKWSKPTC